MRRNSHRPCALCPDRPAKSTGSQFLPGGRIQKFSPNYSAPAANGPNPAKLFQRIPVLEDGAIPLRWCDIRGAAAFRRRLREIFQCACSSSRPYHGSANAGVAMLFIAAAGRRRETLRRRSLTKFSSAAAVTSLPGESARGPIGHSPCALTNRRSRQIAAAFHRGKSPSPEPASRHRPCVSVRSR